MRHLASFVFSSGSFAATVNTPSLHSTARLLMDKQSLSRPTSTASLITTALSKNNDDDSTQHIKPKILCLHGKYQSGAILRNKISGARRKLEREYELHFIDGPILLDNEEEAFAWWNRSEDGKHTLVREAFEYVFEQTKAEQYDAIIGFSQGGTLATSLAVSGVLPSIRVVITAGSPYIPEAFEIATELSKTSNSNGLDIPKLHMAGETDAMVPVDSTSELCEKGGNGQLIVHDQGHLFPTRSARVREILDFLAVALKKDE